MSCSKIDPSLHQVKKPDWIKVRLPSNPVFFSTKALIADLRLHTVCEEAQCPNRWECWSQGTATFMIAGDRCTRACGFCAVATAKPFPLEVDEPERVAAAVRRMRLKHVVVTAVARDDLADGGAQHFAETIEAIRAADPRMHHRSADARFSRAPTMPADRRRCCARHLQSQHRDRRTTHPGGSFTCQISRFARSPAPNERDRADDCQQKRDHAWSRRNRTGNFSDDG